MRALSNNLLPYHKACSYEESGKEYSSASKLNVSDEETSFMFANPSKEDNIYPLTVMKIADKQMTDPALSNFFEQGLPSTKILYDEESSMVIPKCL